MCLATGLLALFRVRFRLRRRAGRPTGAARFSFNPARVSTPHQIGAIYGKHPYQPLHPRTAQDPFLSAEEAIAQGFADKVAGLPTANRTAA